MNPQQSAASGVPVYCTCSEIVRLETLKPNPGNPNVHSARQVAIYATVIRANGWRRPITVSARSGLIVRGEGAFLAAKHLTLEFAPVEFQPYESEAAELADLLADNRLADFATTDADALKAMLTQLAATAPDAITGYSAEDLAALVDEIAPEAQVPITAKLLERHDFVVIYVDNETDWQFLKNLAGVRTERSFKNSSVGEGRVIPFPRFLAALRENAASIGTTPWPSLPPTPPAA